MYFIYIYIYTHFYFYIFVLFLIVLSQGLILDLTECIMHVCTWHTEREKERQHMFVCMYIHMFLSKVLPTLLNMLYSNKYTFKSQMNTFKQLCEMVSYYITLISVLSWTYWKCFNQEPSCLVCLFLTFKLPYSFQLSNRGQILTDVTQLMITRAMYPQNLANVCWIILHKKYYCWYNHNIMLTNILHNFTHLHAQL